MTYATLWDWRRRMAAAYAAIRAAPDPQAAWTDWRHERDTLFRTHPQTPLDDPASFTALPFFPYDPALRFHVDWTGAAGEAVILPAGDDGEIRAVPFARTDGLHDALGAELTAYWIAGYGGGVFLPFADATSGTDTYGGGRYLLDTIKGADLGTAPGNRTVLDFNFSYNPSCAYSSRYVCPLSPRTNRLPRPVRAGEQVPGMA